jgi:heme O synthase-like polyprenyltransferase
MLTAFDPTGIRTVRQVMLYTAALLAVSVLPYTLGLVSIGYLWGTIALGVAFLALGAALAHERTDNRAWKLFFGSIIYLPALLVLLVAFKVPA